MITHNHDLFKKAFDLREAVPLKYEHLMINYAQNSSPLPIALINADDL